MTRLTINPEPVNRATKPNISIKINPNCWICGQEIREGELFVSTLKKDASNFYHANCWKQPEKHGWMT